ncbi:MAG TPA: hypothetical protein VGD98_16110 [Ktedonobacteraceae bacterium]
MEDTLQPLVERALTNQPGFLEFYLRDQSRLPGPRGNVELAQDLSQHLAFLAPAFPIEVRSLLNHLVREEPLVVINTPGEFVVMCGVLGLGTSAIAVAEWREGILICLAQYARSHSARVRESVALAFQKLLLAAPDETLVFLMDLLDRGDCLQLRACLAAISEPSVLSTVQFISSALIMQRVAIEYLHALPLSERKRADVRVLRQVLGYTLSVVTAANPDDGFALMCDIATWNDVDINWVLRENLKKRRLARFREYTGKVIDLMA